MRFPMPAATRAHPTSTAAPARRWRPRLPKPRAGFAQSCDRWHRARRVARGVAPRRAARWLALACALQLASGCIAYRSGALEPGGGLDRVETEATRSIALLVRVKRTVNGEDRDLPANLREDWVRETIDAYRSSGYFTSVRRGLSDEADLQASIQIEDDVVGSPAFAYLSAMTWLLLPSRSRDQLSVRTTYTLPGGEVVGQFRSKETVITWFQAFLLPATPFALRDSVVRGTVGDLSRATAKAARKKGIL